MSLRCMMDIVLVLLLWCCGISSLLPSKASFAETLDNKWQCPHVTNISGISCSCDIPHTVRCRGQVSDEIILNDLIKELQSRNDTTKAISLLDLAVHKIERLPPRIFYGLPLLGLVIARAGLTAIGQDAFKGLENTLAALGLPANNITKVPTDALQGLYKLQRLDLSDNNIESLAFREFPNLFQLRNLNLEGNGLVSVEGNAFANLERLQIVNIGRNKLKAEQVRKKELWNLPFLTDLSLKDNSLQGPIDSEFLSSSFSLITLDLSHNFLTKIKLGALKNCKQLQVLDLSYNKIDIVEDHAFKYLSNLKSLQLSHNQILSVSGWSLSHLPHLSSLDIADNVLMTITADLLHQLPNLQSLDLSTNDISMMQPHVFNFTPSLRSLILEENPLHCDCSLSWFWHWLKNHSILSEEDRKGVVCFMPPNLENVPLIEVNVSDLSCSQGTSDYYHDATDYDEFYEFHLSDSQVTLQEATWIDDEGGLQLVWHVDQRAAPFTCQAVHIYELEETAAGAVHQTLTEKILVNCSSKSNSNAHQVVIKISGEALSPGSFYRYCLVLIAQSRNDEERLLPSCSQALLLKKKRDSPTEQANSQSIKVTSLTAGSRGSTLIVQTRFQNSRQLPCNYNVFVILENTLLHTTHLNCSESRHSFSSMKPANYSVCVKLVHQISNENNSNDFRELKRNLLASKNTNLSDIFASCTTVDVPKKYANAWNSGPLLTLLFTLPGIALLIVLYVVSKKVWKDGGKTWRWDKRAGKSAKYFLYTGEITPAVSLDPLPESSV